MIFGRGIEMTRLRAGAFARGNAHTVVVLAEQVTIRQCTAQARIQKSRAPNVNGSRKVRTFRVVARTVNVIHARTPFGGDVHVVIWM